MNYFFLEAMSVEIWQLFSSFSHLQKQFPDFIFFFCVNNTLHPNCIESLDKHVVNWNTDVKWALKDSAIEKSF